MNVRLIAVSLFALLAVGSARADTSILVDFGRHPTAQAAGNAEAEVNWLDADLRDDRLCTEAFAALELQRYLRAMTGRKDDFAIVDDDKTPEGEWIVVGSPASNAAAKRAAADLKIDTAEIERLGAEGYRIKTGQSEGRRVTLIAGGGREGTLYGVYDLLDRMGCRWFSPAAFDEDVPRTDWNPAFDLTGRPSFAVRGFYVWEKRGSPEFFQWMARNRLNLWCVHADNQPLMRKLGLKLSCGTHDVQGRFINPKAPYPYDHPRFTGDRQKPKDPYPVSEAYRGDADGDGKLSNFEAHPEWYPEVDGRRIPGVKSWDGVNFCTSNPDALSEFVKNYVQAIIDGCYRGADVTEMWMLDCGKWCQCPQCKALGTPTDRNVLVVYRLDREIKKAQREGRLNRPVAIRFLAYADVIEPPTRPLPADFDYKTCTATFFPIKRCYVHQFDNADCRLNSKYRRQLDGWIADANRHYRGQICIGEYYNYSRFRSLPICFMHVMAHDIPHYYDLGARQFHYMHVTTGDWGSKSLTNYQMARQIWDVRTDCRQLWDDYFARRYGPTAPVMRRYYESLETMLSNAEMLKGWHPGLASRLEAGKSPLFPDSHLQYRREPGMKCDAPTMTEMIAAAETCRSLIDRARAMDSTERIQARLAEDERTFAYAERTLRYLDQCAQAYQLAWAGKKAEARKHYEEARRVAELLRKDTWSTSHCYTETFELNGFSATCATAALDRLAKLLEEPSDVRK
jgi:hypothetical protein